MTSESETDEARPPDLGAIPEMRPAAKTVLATLGEARASRYLKADPVPAELLRALVWAASRASSPNNSQLWSFVVVTERDRRRALREALRAFERWVVDLPAPVDDVEARTRAGAAHLLDHLADAPALIVVCAEDAYPPDAPHPSYLWSAIGGASQNLVVAARSMGLGATVTMFHVADEQAVAHVLELPRGVRVGAIIPVGWPARPFGPVRRRPLREVLHHERW